MNMHTKMEAAHGPSPPLSMIDPTASIHPLAYVDGARIGARTRIWQFASVIRGSILGEDCNVASGVTIDGVRFGDRCIISQGVTTAPGHWFGDDVFVGPNVSICNDVWPTTSKEGFDVACLLTDWTVVIRNGASIGAGAVVLPGVVIGERAMIAAAAVVTKDIPADHILTRSGRVIPIDRERLPQRMRLIARRAQ